MGVMSATGALHTSLMEGARQKLQIALTDALPRLRPPKCDVYMNSTGQVLRKGTNPALLIPIVCDQLCMPVMWESCMRGMIAAGMDEFYEVGPMKQLAAMMKRIDADAWAKTSN